MIISSKNIKLNVKCLCYVYSEHTLNYYNIRFMILKICTEKIQTIMACWSFCSKFYTALFFNLTPCNGTLYLEQETGNRLSGQSVKCAKVLTSSHPARLLTYSCSTIFYSSE